ncbi:hypothetical protein C818_02776 [Lachnospiraceae bacterium MD308]|nr:hypothetical protein C818_02776 [Lachnospiraceae bacterium MD308]MCI8503599.1 ABC transporter permease [Dorea sp.]
MSKMRNKIQSQKFILVGITIVLLFTGCMINGQFLRPANVANILITASLLGFVASGQTLVVLSGNDGLDLSVGGVMSLGAVVAYIIMDGSDGKLLKAFFIVLFVGAVVGLFNAVGVVFAEIPALVMTLAVSNALTSVQQLITGGNPTGAPSPAASRIATSKVAAFLPWLTVIWIALTFAMYLLLTRSTYGKRLYAVGSNERAAVLSGIQSGRIRIYTYMICGVLSAFAGFWLCAYNEVIYVNAGASYVMPSVAAVVIGGTSIAGGRGSYMGTAAGTVILTVISSLLVMMDTNEAGKYMMNGVILLVLLVIYTRHPKIRQ